MEDFFYLVINGKSEGPFTKQQLLNMSLTPDTLVWKKGLPEWVNASQLPELQDILFTNSSRSAGPGFENGFNNPEHSERIWFMIVNGNQEGPFTISEVIAKGVLPSTPLWRAGLDNWDEAENHPEFNNYFSGNRQRFQGNQNGGTYPRFGENNPNFSHHGSNPYGNQGYYQGGNQDPNYGYHQNNYGPSGNQNPEDRYRNEGQRWDHRYENGQRPYERNGRYGNNIPTNWLPWAIVGTIVGCLFSCIGLIFGVIAIVQANKANNLYMQDNNREADRVNANAKTMTIISFVFAAIGLVFGAFFFGNGFFNY